jgi:hypothetical protein
VKKTGAMAQVVEWLPCKHKALSSIPSTVKKKKNRKQNKKTQQQFLSGIFVTGRKKVTNIQSLPWEREDVLLC